MKKILSGSKIISFYVLLWGLFAVGILLIILFMDIKSALSFIGLVGFLLGLGSFIFILRLLPTVQNELKARYVTALDNEKPFLTTLFYFARSVFLLIGLFVFWLTFSQQEISKENLVEISGKITSAEVLGQNNPSLKIKMENNSNEYGINTFKIPDAKLQKLVRELQPGVSVFLVIEREHENTANDRYIQIYGIRTETYDYLTSTEYNGAVSTNSMYGLGLGMVFGCFGLIYLLIGKIKTAQNTQASNRHLV